MTLRENCLVEIVFIDGSFGMVTINESACNFASFESRALEMVAGEWLTQNLGVQIKTIVPLSKVQNDTCKENSSGDLDPFVNLNIKIKWKLKKCLH